MYPIHRAATATGAPQQATIIMLPPPTTTTTIIINTMSHQLFLARNCKKSVNVVKIGQYTSRNFLSTLSTTYNINTSSSSSFVSFVGSNPTPFYSEQRRDDENDDRRQQQRQQQQQSKKRMMVSYTLNNSSQKNLQLQQQQQQQQRTRRYYHTTQHNPMVLYGTIILVSTLCYVGYKKYHGEPLKPHSATAAQESYQKLEQDRLERNKKYAASASASYASSSYSTKLPNGQQQHQQHELKKSDTPRDVDENIPTMKK